jgi:F-type H+-transporting ATPase subunit b
VLTGASDTSQKSKIFNCDSYFMEILHKLGIDWKLLLAQGVNFLILLYILKRFAYGPMLRFLDEREARIEDGLKNAEAAAKKLTEAQAEQTKVLAEAQKEARGIVEEALAVAKRRDGENLEKTKEEIARMLTASQAEIASEKNKMLQEAKQELASLVVSATEKITKEKIDATKNKELLEKAIGI